MSLEPGSTIGSYTITREVGRGGMGVVYLARDTRLDRDVAIKALPEELAADPARLERFEREARTLASLNHPNLAGIYGIEEQGGARYLVLEYVEGETIADILDRGPLNVDDALELAVQIAAGVEAAHDAGVIHRDLKPANIKVTPEGKAKVLDFGLARADDSAASSSSIGLSNSPTVTSPVQHSPTIAGAILGTAPYMSPEQARGRKVDKRTDIWSFAVVVYEMLTGVGPFHGETATDSIGAILHKDVDLGLLPRETPRSVRRVLERCLARDKGQRYRDIGDVRLELAHARGEGSVDAGPSRSASKRRGVLIGAVCALVLGIAGWFVGQQMRAPERAVAPMRVSIEPPVGVGIQFSGDLSGPPVVSRDGTKVAFVGAREREMRRLWVRDLGEDSAREIEGTEGALFPFWSPDGREVAYFSTNMLYRVDLASETVQRVCPAEQGRGGTWADDGRILFARHFRGGLWVVDARGGEVEVLTEIDEEMHTSHRWPFFIEGTDQFLFSAVSARVGERENNGLYLGSLDGGAPVRVMTCDYRGEYHDGLLQFVRENVLMAQRMGMDGALEGNPVVIARDVAPDLSTWHGQFSASGSGVLVYNSLGSEESAGEGVSNNAYAWGTEGDRVTSFDEEGREQSAYGVGMQMNSISLSPDGSMLAMDVVSDDGYLDIWVHPTAWQVDGLLTDEVVQESVIAPEARRVTFLPGMEISPVWSPDGEEIAFRWDGDGDRPRGIYTKRIGGGTERLVRANGEADDYPEDWTDDGQYIIATFGTYLVSGDNDIYAVPMDGGDAIPLVTDPGPDYYPKVSPDGKWLAYSSRGSGRTDVYVVPFAPAWPDGGGDRKWLVSENGGSIAVWSREGDRLYYMSESAVLIEVEVEADGEMFRFSKPRAMFQTPWDVGRNYDVTPNSELRGRSFMFMDGGERGDAPIAVIVGWRGLVGER